MEKYRSSADPSTGVHAFLPQPQSPRLLYRVLGSIFFILRVVLLLVSFTAYCLVSPLVCRIPIPTISRIVARSVDCLLLLPLLISLGLWRFSCPSFERPRARAVASDSRPISGDVIVVNHSSPLDALYLAFCYSPIFIVPCKEGLIQLTTISAFLQVGCSPTFHGQKASLDALKTSNAGPIVVFAEGCTTNGRGVLQFAVPASISAMTGKIYAMGLGYSTDRRECYTVGSFPRHLLQMMISVRCRISARMQAVAPGSTSLQQTVASLAGVPALGISREAGARFLEHWSGTGSR